MQLLTRKQFTTPLAVRLLTIDVPALGGAIEVRSLSDAERSDFELAGKGDTREERLADLKRRLIVAATVQPQLQPEDVDAMGAQDSAVIDYIFERIQKHVGISNADVTALVEKPKAD